MKVGFFGLLGAGNLGNDGSLEVLVEHLRRSQPNVELRALCSGPAVVSARYGIPSTRLGWYRHRHRRSAATVALKLVGKLVDPIRTLRWVRDQDVVLVPGTGVLENTLTVRPWGLPYALWSLCLAGRLTRTPVALVGVGADEIRAPVTRRLLRGAARLAAHRSYRDELSRDAVTAMGVDTVADRVCPDLAFALPAPVRSSCPGIVAVGVMDFHGGGDDPAGDAERIHRSYVDAMRRFVEWLLAERYHVRLVVGDEVDERVVSGIIGRLAPDAAVRASRVRTLRELLCELAPVDAVVATRYHNVVCALRLAKPTVSVGYAAKNDRLMARFGLGECCQDARAVDVDRLVEQFRTVTGDAEGVRDRLTSAVEDRRRELAHHLAALDATLFSDGAPAERVSR